MTINLLLTLSVSSDYTGPTHALVTIPPPLAAEIRRYAAVVKELDVYRLSRYLYQCTWGTLDDEDLPADFGPDIWEERLVVDDAEADLLRRILEASGQPRYFWRTECDLLNVTADEAYWTAYLKHTDVRLETTGIPLTLLENIK